MSLKRSAFAISVGIGLLILANLSVIALANTTEGSGKTAVQVQAIMGNVKKTLESRDFKSLKPFVPDDGFIWLVPCGGHDSGVETRSFDAMSQLLLRNSIGKKIDVNPEYGMELGTNNTVLQTVTIETKGWNIIETEGWKGHFQSLRFVFDLLKSENRWVWSGICYSPTMMK